MFSKIKNNIKKAKIAGIAFAVVFLLLILNSIYLTHKVCELNEKIATLELR